MLARCNMVLFVASLVLDSHLFSPKRRKLGFDVEQQLTTQASQYSFVSARRLGHTQASAHPLHLIIA